MSNALVPLENMPAWLKAVALVNPFTYAITLMRETILVGIDWQLVTKTLLVLALFNGWTFVLARRSMSRAERRGYST